MWAGLLRMGTWTAIGDEIGPAAKLRQRRDLMDSIQPYHLPENEGATNRCSFFATARISRSVENGRTP